jgi:hypothetical protein
MYSIKHTAAGAAIVAGYALLFGTSSTVAMELIGKASYGEQDHPASSDSSPLEVHMKLAKRAGPHCGFDELLLRGERASLYLRGIRATGQPAGIYRVLLGAEYARPSTAAAVGEINFYGITDTSARDVSFFIDSALLKHMLEVTSDCSVRVFFIPARPAIARPEFAIDSIELWAGPID